jgi:hypothetical protein
MSAQITSEVNQPCTLLETRVFRKITIRKLIVFFFRLGLSSTPPQKDCVEKIESDDAQCDQSSSHGIHPFRCETYEYSHAAEGCK